MGPGQIDPGPLALHVPRLVREWVNDPATVDERYQSIAGSMLFADVSGFTKLSDRLSRQGRAGSEAITAIIGACFTELINEAYRYGGTLLQFGGDAVLLFFRGEDHERRAAGAALAMRASLRVTREDLPVVGTAPLSMTMGVHSGDFDFFLVGSSHRQLVVGGPASSRLVELEESASRGRILISPDTAAALPRANIGAAEQTGIRLCGHIDPAMSPGVQFLDVGADMGPYVATEIRRAVSQGEVHPEHRTATVAFVDFEGLDDVLAAHGPAEAAARLDDLMRGLQAAIDPRSVCFQSADVGTNGGKFYLSVGAPRSTGGDEEAMLLALREIVDLEVSFPLRAGVNSGPVFMGEIRTRHRHTFITMGDAVNLAARVMGKSATGTLLATHPVLDRSRTLFEEVPREPFTVRGKTKPVEATVVGPARGVRPGIGASDLPTVGRDEELAAYAAVAAAVLKGAGRYVEVVADAGAGKSRLLDEFEHHDVALPFHRARCRLYQSATPYFAFGELLRDVFGLGGLSIDERTQRVTDLASQAGVAAALPLVGIVFGLEIEGAAPDDPEIRKAQLEQATLTLLERSLTQPAALCLEDAHWMDDPSRDLLAALTNDLRSRPWLLVSAHRRSAGGIDVEPDLLLDLHPLPPSALTALIRAATQDAPLAPHVVDTLVERSGGNPLFLLEMVNGIQSGGDVASLPTSIEGLLSSRIDRLATDDRALLRHIAVLGNEFDQQYIVDVLPASVQAEPDQALLRLTDFVAISDRGWVSFRHHLVRDAAYRGLPYRTRRALHAAVAESVQARVGDEADDVAALLSIHYWRARRFSEAWTYSVRAGDLAAEVYANAEAVELYRRALGAATQLDLPEADVIVAWEKLGDVQDLAGMSEDARRSYTRARRAESADRLTQARLWLKTAYIDDRTGKFTAAIRAVRSGERLLDSRDDRGVQTARGQLSGWEAAVRLRQGRLAEAAEASRRAISIAEEVDDPATRARGFLTLDFALAGLGEETDFSGSHTALEIYTELGDLAGEASAANTLGGFAFFEGDFDGAAAFYRRSRATREKMGDPSGVALADVNLAEVLVQQGHLDSAEALLDDVLAVWRATHDAGGIAFAHKLKGIVSTQRGDLDAAAASLVEARAGFEAIGSDAEVEEVDEAIAALDALRTPVT